jgi:GDPmannose 4,6-dehydratase
MSKARIALITGITGMDGSHLAEILLDKGYEVHGIVRRSSTPNTSRIDHIYDPHNLQSKLHLHVGDLSDANSINRIVQEVMPDECYNLGAQSDVRLSFDKPEYTADITGLGVLRILEALRFFKSDCKFYQASSSELFGIPYEVPQNENTKIHPRSPYGVAKQFGYSTTVNFRESYGIHASNGILYNHEGKRRGENFLTRKVTKAAASIKLGLQDCLYLGNMYAQRDWGYAPDFCEAMWLMLQQEEPGDYVIATGETHTIKDFVNRAFDLADLSLKWEGEGVKEIGVEKRTGKVLVQIDPKYYRPAEVKLLLGDYSKAKEVLNWEPKVKFDELVKIMFENDLRLLSDKENVKSYDKVLNK